MKRSGDYWSMTLKGRKESDWSSALLDLSSPKLDISPSDTTVVFACTAGGRGGESTTMDNTVCKVNLVEVFLPQGEYIRQLQDLRFDPRTFTYFAVCCCAWDDTQSAAGRVKCRLQARFDFGWIRCCRAPSTSLHKS